MEDLRSNNCKLDTQLNAEMDQCLDWIIAKVSKFDEIPQVNLKTLQEKTDFLKQNPDFNYTVSSGTNLHSGIPIFANLMTKIGSMLTASDNPALLSLYRQVGNSRMHHEMEHFARFLHIAGKKKLDDSTTANVHLGISIYRDLENQARIVPYIWLPPFKASKEEMYFVLDADDKSDLDLNSMQDLGI